jgi:hypothetical protein
MESSSGTFAVESTAGTPPMESTAVPQLWRVQQNTLTLGVEITAEITG